MQPAAPASARGRGRGGGQSGAQPAARTTCPGARAPDRRGFGAVAAKIGYRHFAGAATGDEVTSPPELIRSGLGAPATLSSLLRRRRWTIPSAPPATHLHGPASAARVCQPYGAWHREAAAESPAARAAAVARFTRAHRHGTLRAASQPRSAGCASVASITQPPARPPSTMPSATPSVSRFSRTVETGDRHRRIQCGRAHPSHARAWGSTSVSRRQDLWTSPLTGERGFAGGRTGRRPIGGPPRNADPRRSYEETPRRPFSRHRVRRRPDCRSPRR